MFKKSIIIKKDSFIFKKQEYWFKDASQINSFKGSNLKIVVLEEEVYSKYFYEKVWKRDLNNIINIKLKKEFPEDYDILYDYKQSKNGKIFAIYSIKCGERIIKICKNACNIEIKPIQYIIKDIGHKHLKFKEEFNILTKFQNHYYYISVKKKLLFYGFAEKSLENIIKRIVENEHNKLIYIDTLIDKNKELLLKEDFKLSEINLGDLINENLYGKQKFYT